MLRTMQRTMLRTLINSLSTIVVFLWVSLSVAQAAPTEVIVTPGNLQGWAIANQRSDSNAQITGVQPRSGDGSLEFRTNFTTAGQDKVDFELVWDPTVFPARTLNNLSFLSYEYYRDSTGSNVAAHFHPVLRLGWYNDSGTPLNTGDDTLGFLIYEEIYQSVNPVPVDTWDINSIDFTNHNFWMYCIDCDTSAATVSGVVQNFNTTLQNWKAGPVTGNPGDPVPPDLSQGTTYIFSVNTGIGSGWNNDVLMFVDNVHFAFGANDDFNYNFELKAAPRAVPLFSPLGLLALLLLLLGASRYYLNSGKH